MGKILIANVGNRTLVMKNSDGTHKEYDTKEKGKNSFREATKVDSELMDLDESILDSLDSNIIDAIFKKEDIDRIYLFTSDQDGSDEKLKRKDTLYAGKILSKLLPKKYPKRFKSESVKDITLTGISAVNLDKLTISFREELLKLVEQKHKGEKFIICDSGGTPQQKNALKIVAEYFLDKENVDFYQVYEEDEDENGVIGKSHAEIQKFHQIRTIADAQSISLLINQGEYAAAAYIGKLTQHQTIQNLLWLMHFRLLLRDIDAKKSILPQNQQNTPATTIPATLNGFLRINKWIENGHGSIFSFLTNKPTGDFNKWKNDITNENDFFRLCEVLEVASFYWHKEDWTNAVLNYQIFFERFLRLMIKKEGFNLDEDLQNQSFRQQLQTDDIRNKMGVRLTDRSGRPTQITISIPSEMAYLEVHNSLSSQSVHVCRHIKKCHSWWTRKENPALDGIDSLRNQIAHEGIGITRLQIDAVVGDFYSIIKEWHKTFGVSFEIQQNAFYRANEDIKKQMQKN